MVLGILAHVDAGKTTLTEALLYKSGFLRTAGRVDRKNSFLDNDPQERERGITIISKQAQLKFDGLDITLLDTPGHVDFSAEAESVLQVLDYCILVISAADGVKGHTLTIWSLLKQYNIPCFIFVNKMDQPGADKEAVLSIIKEKLSDNCMDLSVINDELSENIAMCDEELMEQYLEDHACVDEKSISRLISMRKLFPVLFGSALRFEGMDELIRQLREYTLPGEYPGEFAARVFKISRDPRGERLTHMKICGGKLKVKDIINEEKVNQIRLYSGEKFESLTEAEAGQIVTVTGLEKSCMGSGYGAFTDSSSLLLEPVLGYSVISNDHTDTTTLYKYLTLIEEEDPQLKVSYNEEHKEILVQVMGEVQLQVLKRNVHDRFGCEIDFGDGRVVYKETIESPVEGVGHFEPLRHYAEVHLLIEPLERGSGLSFDSVCSEDILAKNWQRLILTHLGEKLHRGVLTGSPLTDVKISILTGRAHPKHTEGGDFRQATYRAVRHGLMYAQSILLEPWYFFRIDLPAVNVGRAMTDIDAMSGTMDAPVTEGERAYLSGRAPVACIHNYAKDLAAYTAGNGSISLSLAGYDICHNAEEVIAQRAYSPEADLRNTPDSVFCAHGAGFVVPWYEVYDYMHLESPLSTGAHSEESTVTAGGAFTVHDGPSLGTEEVDAILNRTFYSNSNNTVKSAAEKRKGVGRTEMIKTVSADKYDDYVYRPVDKKPAFLIVDGYNCIFAWEELRELAKDNLDSARDKLIDLLANYQGYTGCELMVVFDAYRVKGKGSRMRYPVNVQVVYTAENETADAHIERYTAAHNKEFDITVATSDLLEQNMIWGNNCRRMSARELELAVRSQ